MNASMKPYYTFLIMHATENTVESLDFRKEKCHYDIINNIYSAESCIILLPLKLD